MRRAIRRALLTSTVGVALAAALGAAPAAAHEASDLASLCDDVGHDCGEVVNTPDARIIGEHYGHDIGEVLNEADVERILALANDVQAAGTTAVAPAQPTNTVWDQLAQCEASGDWGSTVGLYEGGLQFHPDTWDAYKPAGYPDAAYQATREQQIAVAELVLADQGWGAWPACSSELGLR